MTSHSVWKPRLYFQTPSADMLAAKWGRLQSPLSRAVKSYPLADSNLKKAPPLLQIRNLNINAFSYDFSYFVLFTYVFSLFLEVSHGTAALTHFSLIYITATLLTHSTAVVLTHSIAILIALPHWCSIYSGQSCRLFFS